MIIDKKALSSDILGKYNYILLMGVSSLLIMAKSYLYSFIMEQESYSDLNLYFLSVSTASMFAPLGFLLKCHSELPVYLRSQDHEKTIRLLSQAKSAALVGGIGLVVIGLLFFDSPGIRFGTVQGLLYSLFFIDQILVKSKLLMNEYAGRVFTRNFLVSMFGLAGFILFGSVLAVYLLEAISSLFLCLYFGNLKFTIPGNLLSSMVLNKGFFLVEFIGLGLGVGERGLAGYFFEAEDFALFSFFYLSVISCMTLQQFINTRFFTEISLSRDFSLCLRRSAKVSACMFSICGVVTAVVLGLLSFNQNYFSQVSIFVMAAFIVLGALKGADFFQSLFVVFSYKKFLIAGQIFYILVMTSSVVILDRVTPMDLASFLVALISASLIYYLYLIVILIFIKRCLIK